MADEPTFIHPSRRYRLFFDETGTGDIYSAQKDSQQKYLSVTGIVFRQDIHDGAVTKALTALRADIFGAKNSSVILHRREIMDRKGVFSALEDDALRRKFDDRFKALVRDIEGPVFTVSIDKEAHLERYKVWQFNPYHYVTVCLLERFVLWLNSCDYTGDVMGEARNPTHDGQLRRSFRHFYQNGTTVRTSVIQKRLISKELRLELKKTNVAALQIADLLAHPAHRSYRMTKLGETAPKDYGSSVADILVESKYHRNPKTGAIEGYGRKWLP
jgi:Protein of unknown function (DUF3800)